MDPIISDDGSPSLYSSRYGEGYRSRRGARSESWHVFVAGSGVAARLAGALPTTVLEIGLGTARNLGASATVAFAFGAPLRYVALEHDLLSADDWARLEPDALGPAPFRSALLAARRTWDAAPGTRHTLRVGPVTLEVHRGDARAATWPTGVDAVYLDGFSPSVNPELWTDEVLARVASQVAPGGTVVSYCVQGRVRRALQKAGLRVEKRAGPPGGKREVMWARRPSEPSPIAEPPLEPSRPLAGARVAIVGAGVAGRSLAWAATRAGATVVVFDASDGHAGASGVPAALVNPYRGRAGRATDDDRLGAELTWSWASQLAGAGLDPGAHPTGVVRVADGPRQARSWSARPGTQPFGPEATPAAGRWRAPDGGMLVPRGGWIDPVRWLGALRSATRAHGGLDRPATRVTGLTPAAGGAWRMGLEPSHTGVDEDPFDVVALCLGASPPGALPHLPVTTVAGTVALVAGHLPARPLAGAVYAAPVGSPVHHRLDPLRAWFAVGGGHTEIADDADAAAGLLATLARHLPAELAPAEGWTVHATWRGSRARGPDPRPQVERLAPGVWWFGSFAGRGFLRAALEAERLVERWGSGPS